MKKTKKKHRLRSYIVILLFFYLVAMLGYYIFSLSIKNIYISGTTYLNDLEIIDKAGLKKYPSILKVSSKTIENRLKKLDLVTDVEVSKTLTGKLYIKITEAKVLFYSRNNNLVYLGSGKTIKNENKFLGIPVLINYVPKDILNDFINKFKNINSNLISMISEIEYSPEQKDDVNIDETRFLFRMNDTNTIYVNTINLKRFNSYDKIFATLTENVYGTLYLNSNRENISFQSYEAQETLKKELESKKETEEDSADGTNED